MSSYDNDAPKKDDINGIKYDSGKPILSLLEYQSLVHMAKVLEHGAKKYERDNWKKGIHVSRILSAALRHVFLFNEGYDIDFESKLPHLAHAMVNLSFALWMIENKPEFDDR